MLGKRGKPGKSGQPGQPVETLKNQVVYSFHLMRVTSKCEIQNETNLGINSRLISTGNPMSWQNNKRAKKGNPFECQFLWFSFHQ